MIPRIEYRFSPAPKTVGGYEILHGLYFNTAKKPAWVHRMFTRLLLGWRWVDAK